MVTIQLGSQTIKGDWATPNLFIPTALRSEWLAHTLVAAPTIVASSMPDQLFLLSSVISSWNGRPRRAGSSHLAGFSVDLAPAASREQVLRPDGGSPNLCDNLRVATFLAQVAQRHRLALVLEDDHLHVDSRWPAGAYLYQSRHSVYAHAWNGDPRTGRLYLVTDEGEVKLAAKPSFS